MPQSKVVVIDGGFATQLTVHVGKSVDGDPLWSARFNATNPEAVVKTHLDFLVAGAEAIITNTYQASVEGYNQYLNFNDEQSITLIKDTVKLAHVARSMYLKREDVDSSAAIPLILGSIGPYGAHLHDGSEYTGSYADRVTKDTIKNWHRVRIDAVLSAGVDALAIETIPCLMEAEALIELLCSEYPQTKFWISFQCKVSVYVSTMESGRSFHCLIVNGKLKGVSARRPQRDGSSIANGESFPEAALRVWNIINERQATNNLLAVGVNCLHPRFIAPLFQSLNGNLAPEHRLPLVAYPNSGEVYNVEDGWTGKEDCVPLESYVAEWINLGAKFVGGCCRTYAKDIGRIKSTVQSLCGDA